VSATLRTVSSAQRVVVLAGGFGGAKMAHGFALLGERVELTVVGNTADDLELHGLHISPDLDTVMYTLAGLANPDTGWGVRDETWWARAMLEGYGEPTWFALGDRDLATHIVRTARLRSGARLTDATGELTRSLGVAANLLPMSDDPVRTKVRTPTGWLDFQEYFVRRGHRDEVLELRFDGLESARPTQAVLDALAAAQLIVLAPSNPFVSIGPILGLAGVVEAVAGSGAPVVAVSPIVGGAALRGPADRMLRSLGADAGSAGIARHYAGRYPGLIRSLVIDEADAADELEIRATGIEPLVAPTVMRDERDRRRLAEAILTAAGAPGAKT
jgi:LPPG:FO 2-phospho-L-lactate transferase